ncbi:AraC family transcriptional regulator [Paenibacillus radicis (ex Xue et al. 2023)]|uniref:AraC family transcriptional regulator n=1 Tax=Paenibacillus radicis (ex Xue et al. 2023) TaxID=2972489 RepID=A0ABT1YQ34_9BACL|nr:AraC family transcriptional regulator [Paenibacillus radicis (ex Xue et al. 2023)]MCR8635288.1 AraC family transcriptional regulator [Paenibacillus radicis (ex Xue et al. 2023)]
MHSCYVRDLDSSWSMKRAVTPYNLLMIISNGSLTYWVDGEDLSLQAGDVLFIPAGSVRGGTSNEQHQRYATHFSSLGDEELLPLLASKQPCKLKLQNIAYFKQRFSLLNHHWLTKGPYSSVICCGILLEMLGIVNHELDHQNISTKKVKLVEDLKAYIHSHYKSLLKLQELADYTGRSPNYISYVFKEATGFTPIEYLHNVRISIAKDLMLSKLIPIREIADQTGFSDQAYFNRVFKKVTGYSPTYFVNKTTEKTVWSE